MPRDSFKAGEPVAVGRGVDAFLEPVLPPKKKKHKLIAVTFHIWDYQIDWLDAEVNRREADIADNASKAAMVREALDAYIVEQEESNE